MLSQSSLGTFDNLNSMNGKGVLRRCKLSFDSLMDRALDESHVMYPLLAEKVSYDPDHLKDVILFIKPQACFLTMVSP